MKPRKSNEQYRYLKRWIWGNDKKMKNLRKIYQLSILDQIRRWEATVKRVGKGGAIRLIPEIMKIQIRK